MKAIDELVIQIVDLLGQYFNVNINNDEIYNIIENAVYEMIGDVEFEIMQWLEE